MNSAGYWLALFCFLVGFYICRFTMGDAHRWYIDTLSGLKISVNIAFVKSDFAMKGHKTISVGHRPTSQG